MKNCIICRKKQKEFDLEHIIPDSIGGTITIDTVCKLCNSKLGSNIDKHLVEHFFSITKREELQIKSQNNVIPHSLGYHEFFLKSDKNQLIKLDTNKNGFRLVPKVNKEKNEASFDIADTINIKNFCKKHQITISEFDIMSVSDELAGRIEIDTFKFNIALFKIAYEFAVKEIPIYFEDEKAKIISSIIYDIAYSKVEISSVISGFIKYHSSLLESNFFNSFNEYINLDSNDHLLILFSAKELGLVCSIKIFNMFYFSIQLSDIQYDIDTLIYENRLNKSNSKTESLIEFLSRKNIVCKGGN